MITFRYVHAAAALCLLLAFTVFSQQEAKFDFYARGEYRPNIPRPQSILRYDVGDFHTTYAQMEQVINAIAASAPDRVKIFDIGETNEHRMQHLVAISSPENMARLDEIKANIGRLADPRKTSPAEAQQIIQNSPSIAWMAYTIHGNESASFEAMMQVMYQLAASNEPETLNILKNTVVLLLTGENPDGHERFVTFYNSIAVGDPNRSAYEHREPWAIFGRYSHFRFDLNRDTLAQSQKETQNMQAAFMDWHPQLSIDHHGQPSQMFFPPDSLPINPNLPEPAFGKWNEMYGRANAAAFDANHWDYYVRDIYDAFYPGYWDMYPSLNGAIGMTYETDGGGFKGLRWTRDDGTIVTLRSAIAKHYVAGLTALSVTANRKNDRLKDYYNFHATAMRDAANTWKIKRIVITPDKDPVKAAELVELLRRSNIEVRIASDGFSSKSAHSYMEKNAPAAARNFPAGSYVVDLNQPQAVLAKAILEQDTPQDKAFVDDNMGRFRRNQMRGSGQTKEEFGFYDITAWSLPLAFGVDAWWTEDAGPVNGAMATSESIAALRRGSFGGRANVAYIIPYDSDATGAAMIRLLQQGYRIAVSTKPLNAAGRNWPRGTFVIRVSRNPETIHDAVAKLANDLGIRVVAANSGFPDEGDTGIGSENVNSLRTPKIAMVADDAVDQTSYGSIWWTLDRYGIPFTALSVSAIKGGALRDFNVLILPDGSAGRYMALFGAGGVSTLKEFASGGGTIITVRGGSVFAALKDVNLTSSRLVGSDADDEKGKAEEDKKPEPSAVKPVPSPSATPIEQPDDLTEGVAPSLPPIASPSADNNKVPVALPGSIMRATVDRTTYLTYGLEQNELPVLLASGYFFRYSKEGNNAIVFDAKPRRPLTISGFTWDGNTERLLAGTAYVIDEPTGGGHVILFAEEPFFRGLFRTTTRPFMNSILFNGTF
ncbi:MAG TPA: M14 family zinc carboxypeptidase [Pyrinomonadaceae bacterium]